MHLLIIFVLFTSRLQRGDNFSTTRIDRLNEKLSIPVLQLYSKYKNFYFENIGIRNIGKNKIYNTGT